MDSMPPLPCGERVGVRVLNLSIDRNPSPGLLRNPTSPIGRGKESPRSSKLQNPKQRSVVAYFPQFHIMPMGVDV